MTATVAGRGLDGALLRYRIMAWITGTLLALLCCIGLPLQYVAGQDAVGSGWTVHGFLYIVYVLTAFVIVRRMRWPLLPSLVVLLAGTIPFLTFVAEHEVTKRVRAAQGRAAAPATAETAPRA
jgi:integral membrane protein